MSPDPETRAKQILERLVAFESVSDRSNLSVVAYIEDYLRSLGVASRRAPNIRGDKAALWATIGPDADGGVVLSGHMDVVPVAGQVWTGDPFSLREIDGRLYARGACDMKGFVASALAMVPAFQAAAPKRPVHLLFSYDEETTCLGSLDFITAFGTSLPRPGLVIVGEPTMMEVADAHKGVATFQTRVTGVEAHSARPSLGANAISAACEIVAEIDRLGRECEAPERLDLRFDPPYSTYHVGMIHGGNARNILARECVFHWEFRGLPNFSARSALERVQRFVDDTALPRLRRFAGSASVETVMEVDVPGLRAEAESAAATLALRLGRSNQTIAVSYATEAGHFQLAGLPTIVCGPGSIDQAHKPDEYLDTAQLRACLAFLRELSEANAK
jgi:acetylornithine deacetylase